MSIKFSKVLIVLLFFLAGIWGLLAISQYKSGKKIQAQQELINKLQDMNKALEADRTAWKVRAEMAEQQAQAFQKVVEEAKKEAAEQALKAAALEAKLKALPKPKLPTDPNSLPHDQNHLLGAFRLEGFAPYPVMDPKSLAFPVDQSTRILALVKDGKGYPGALARIELMEDDIEVKNKEIKAKDDSIANLEAETKAFKNEVADLEKINESCEKEVLNQAEIIKAKDTQKAEIENQLSKEKPKKWVTFTGGLLIGLLISIL
jgi:hypothetical protein